MDNRRQTDTRRSGDEIFIERLDHIDAALQSVIVQTSDMSGRLETVEQDVETIKIEGESAHRALWGDSMDSSDTGLVGMRSDLSRIVTGFDRLVKVGLFVGSALFVAALSVIVTLIQN